MSDTINIRTDSSLVKFSRHTPSLLYYGIDNSTGKISNQCFNVILLSLQEVNPDQHSYIPEDTFPIISLVDLPYVVSDSITLFPDYNSYSEYYYYDYTRRDSVPVSINYTIPGIGGFNFQVFPADHTIDNRANGNDIVMKSGTVKFSMFLTEWNFLDSSRGKLRLVANISVDDGMYSCELHSLQSSNETLISCNSAELFGTLNLFNYALSNGAAMGQISLLDVDISKIDILFGESHNARNSTDTMHKCHNKDSHTIANIQTMQVFLDVHAFTGPMFYDPEISVLFTGSDSRGNGNGCDSSETNVDWVLTYLSLSFLGVALIAFISISILSRNSTIRKLILGKEGSRIELSRKSQRKSERSERASELFSNQNDDDEQC